MIALIACVALAIAALAGFLWGRHEGLKHYEQLRYEAVAAIRTITEEADKAYCRLPHWRRSKKYRVDTKGIVKGYRLLAFHLKEVEL